MEVGLFWLFMMAIYATCGLVSKGLFIRWCNVITKDWQVAYAAANLMALVWPLGWLLVIVIGIYSSVISLYWSARVVIQHFAKLRGVIGNVPINHPR